MGTRWSAKVAGANDGTAEEIQSALDGVVAEMSHWEASSDLSAFNRSTIGAWQPLPAGFARVLQCALTIAETSGGAFDPAMGLLADLWGFGPAGPRATPPEAQAVAAALARSGHAHIQQQGNRARRTGEAALDFSGIAKGFGVDAAAERLRALGFQDFLVEVGGELRGEGVRPDAQPWWVDVEAVPGATLAPIRVALHGLSVATSGDYRRHFLHGGRRYAHTIDPRTGAPLENGVASVTVFHADCMIADGWATALTVLGAEQGPAVAEREGLAMQMVLRDSDGFRELLSPGLVEMLG